jgi:DNA-directed RNA polymerase specialized sigma24 family protein
MTAGARTSIAQPDPARSPAAVAQLPAQHRRSGHTSRGTRARTATGADPARGDPVVIDLASRARQGEQQAWDALVERYCPLIWSICRRHRLSDADAEDVVQSAWLKLAQQLDRIHDPAALPGWLLAVERHAALREAFLDLPPSDQRLIALLIEDPPVPYAQISARLGIPIGSIGPTRSRCLDKLRRHPAIAALINPGGSDRPERPSAGRRRGSIPPKRRS